MQWDDVVYLYEWVVLPEMMSFLDVPDHRQTLTCQCNKINVKLESSQSLHTSAKAMLFTRWQHHLRFCSGFPYAPLKAMVTKISKWSRIQDSLRITPKIESLVVYAIPDMPSKFQKDPFRTFWVFLLTHRQTNKQTNKVWQKHNLLGRGENAKSFRNHKAHRAELTT